jgi:Ca-activated chloride channel family protein
MRLLKRIVAGALVLLAGLGLATAASAADRAIIILDGSGSMWAQIDGEARITIARETLDEVLDEVPDDMELGFMTYGHREKGDCSDIEMLVEPAVGTADQIREAADEITPLGKTPISDAVRLAAEDLKYTEDKATVILITDGIESCEADPCELASELESKGVDFTTHVIGFGLNDDEGEQVACLAENTGGKYLQASDAGQLAAALKTTVTEVAEEEDDEEDEPEAVEEEEPEPAVAAFNFDPDLVLYEGGPSLPADINAVWEFYRVATNGEKGEKIDTQYGAAYQGNLEPGDYIVSVYVDWAKSEQPVTIEAGETATPVFNLNGGHLVIHPLAAEGEDPNSGAAVEMHFPTGDSTTSYGDTSLYVPAGETEAIVSLGNGQVTESIEVEAGAAVERDVIVGVGHVVFNANYVEGMKVEDSGLVVNIVGAKKDLQGNRKDFGTNYGPDTAFDLPPGDYVAVMTMGAATAEAPFTVKAGEASTVEASLEAGVLAIAAPGYDFVEVLSAKKDIAGNQKSLANGYGGQLQTTIAAGDYVISAEPSGGGEKKQTTATVAAGERTEVTVE